ncbi:dihydroorotate dehydrogenase-like protein [Kiritimatiellota bacterium B12222]|nr:dihydroorotate dehydrogenase-like protein [Kiritimatiellota bacterium B12222]
MNLKTTYLGLDLKNPIVPSASPLSQRLDHMKQLEDAGASAIVMFSLFEEQIRAEAESLEDMLSMGTDSFAESLEFFPRASEYSVGPDAYLNLISDASASLDIPIIGSLNGVTPTGWIDYARNIQEAGAQALELNVYHVATDLNESSVQVEQRYVDILKAVKASVDIPVAIKLSPYFSSMANMSKRLVEAGCDGLVLFNRFYQPDYDLESLQVTADLNLSTSHEIRLPLLWLAVLKNRLNTSLAASTGVETHVEVLKYLMAGADVTMTASSLITKGPGHVRSLIDGLTEWMDEHEYVSVEQLKGSMSQSAVADPSTFERANYIKILEKNKAEYTLTG